MQRQSPDSRKIRIAFAWNFLEWGGAQMHMLGIARQLRDRVEATVVMPLGSSPAIVSMFESEGIEIEWLRRADATVGAPGLYAKLRRRLGKMLSEAEMVLHLARPGRFDIVHAELGPWQSLPAMALMSLRVPLFYTMHNRLPEAGAVRGLIWRVMFRIAALLPNLRGIASNNDTKVSLSRFAPSDFVDDVTVAPTYVSWEELSVILSRMPDAAGVREGVGLSEGEILCVSVGQFLERKGVDLMQVVAERLSTRRPDIKFVWITNSESVPDAPDKNSGTRPNPLRTLRMPADVSDREELLRLVAAADIFVLPSRVEGLPIALLEAMALGRACVASNINGIPEAVVHKETGILVEAGDVEALIAEIEQLADHPEVRSKLGEAAAKLVLSRFEEREVARTVWEAYRKAHG